FSHGGETVETVENPGPSATTPLKRGVNEICLFPDTLEECQFRAGWCCSGRLHVPPVTAGWTA
ncbi:MAG: hypothetical protein NTW03_20800, partial [Verrucomicrobia bacterium]|nr:hypothetical protein [Verrucomicrobiota bacterium]